MPRGYEDKPFSLRESEFAGRHRAPWLVEGVFRYGSETPLIVNRKRQEVYLDPEDNDPCPAKNV